MRQHINKKNLQTFFEAISKNLNEHIDIYFTGGVTALLHGWRQSTIDIDLVMFPESDNLFRKFPELKNSLNINIEIASPAHFIPELPEWKERSIPITKIGNVSFFHYDLYSQALSKIERGHSQDVQDVKKMIQSELVKMDLLQSLFQQILPKLYKYPAINKESFEKTFYEFVGKIEV